jgi:hypothetical protein
MARKSKRRCDTLPVLHPDAAGIDVGASELYVAVSADRDRNPSAAFPASLAICMRWPTGLCSVGFAPWRWSRQAFTGFPFTRSWKRAVLKFTSSTHST